MSLFPVASDSVSFDTAQVNATDVWAEGFRSNTVTGAVRAAYGNTMSTYNQGIPLDSSGVVCLVDSTASLPTSTFSNGLPISNDKLCLSNAAMSTYSNGLPMAANGGLGGLLTASMALDFINSTTLDPRITFTRASSATYFGSDGLLKTASNDVPRFDYDPATLIPKGLLIEESRVNNFLNSDLAGTNLTTQSVTVTAAPWSVSFTGTGTITFSGAFVGSLVGSGANTRVSTTFTPTAGSLTCTVTGTVKWAQAELGAAASSFIPTAASTVTRAADLPSMPTAGWFNATSGTFVVEFTPTNTTLLYTYGVVSSGPSARYLYGNVADHTVKTFDGTTIVSSVQNVSLSNKVAVSYVAGVSRAIVVNGGTVANSATCAAPFTAGTVLYIGNIEGVSSFLNGNVRSVRYYNTKLSDATLQALTT